MNFAVDFVGVTFFQFVDERIALEKCITLLVNFKLFETQIRDAVGHVFQFIRRGQRLLLLVKDTRQQQAALQDGNLLFNIAFRLQRPLQPVFDFNVLLHQLITVFSRGNQTLT